MPYLPDVVEFVTGYAAGKVLDPVVDRAVRRVRAVVDRASRKAIDRGPIPVDERTAWAVIEAARTTDDSIVADYLGGVLAASGEDDAGAPVAALIGRLSSFDLRLHYTLYRVYQPFMEIALASGRETAADARYPEIFVPTRELLPSLGVDGADVLVLERGLVNLGRERLLGEALRGGWNGPPHEPYVLSADGLRRWEIEQPEHGLVFVPSANGMSLMAWGLGLTDTSPLGYGNASIPATIGDIELPAPPTAILMSELPRAPKPRP